MSASLSGPAYGLGLATVASDGTVLDTWYPDPVLGTGRDWAAERAARVRRDLAATAAPLSDGRAVRVVETAVPDLAAPPVSTADAYLRLHLLSARLATPRSINLDGIFALLPVNAWTSSGPVRPDDVAALRMAARGGGQNLVVYGVDHFPRMTDYVIPGGVRIADADRVRLGAHLAAGTVVMHEGFCNFNAGTLGACMVEGRISQGVVVGDGSDIGGGASIMGTLSGGGTEQVTIGAHCLIGANAGVGISLGDHCIVEAGLYLTAGTKVAVQAGAQGGGDTGAQGGGDAGAQGGGVAGTARVVGGPPPSTSASARVASGPPPVAPASARVASGPPPVAPGSARIVAARELSGADGLLFRRNSLTGEVQALRNTAAWAGLNSTLHDA